MSAAAAAPAAFPPGSLILAGPSASGKSAVALALASQLGAAIVSVDSMQVYQGMDVGTAKPTAAERGLVPHHLIDLVEVTDSFDAARFLTCARGVLDTLVQTSQPAVCVGGTGLYFNVLLRGLSEAQAPDPAVRAALEATPLPVLVAALAAEDPSACARIDCANPRRVIRALERARAGGGADGAATRAWRPQAEPLAVPVLALRRDAADLKRRIGTRVSRMFEQGLVEETRQLLARGLGGNRTALQALGYRQVVEHLRGEYDLAETQLRIRQKTWQYARRQLTWFRHQLAARWVDVAPDEEPEITAQRILEILKL